MDWSSLWPFGRRPPARPRVSSALTIFLDRPRELRLDCNAFERFEEATGKRVLSPVTWATVGLGDLVVLVWAAHVAAIEAPYLLEGRQPPEDLDILPIGAVRALITHDRLEDLQEVLERAWGLFFPEPTTTEPGEPTEDPPES